MDRLGYPDFFSSAREPQGRIVPGAEEEAQHPPGQLGRGRFPLRRLAEEIQSLAGFVEQQARDLQRGLAGTRLQKSQTWSAAARAGQSGPFLTPRRRPPMRKALIALTLAGSLAAGRPALLDQIWSLLASAWSAPPGDAGCIFDPDGRCTPAPQTDACCRFDPNGSPCRS
jgi:hypothetical protein